MGSVAHFPTSDPKLLFTAHPMKLSRILPWLMDVHQANEPPEICQRLEVLINTTSIAKQCVLILIIEYYKYQYIDFPIPPFLGGSFSLSRIHLKKCSKEMSIDSTNHSWWDPAKNPLKSSELLGKWVSTEPLEDVNTVYFLRVAWGQSRHQHQVPKSPAAPPSKTNIVLPKLMVFKMYLLSNMAILGNHVSFRRYILYLFNPF